MKRSAQPFLAALLALTVAACAGIPVSQDFERGFDFSGLQTFAFASDAGGETAVAGGNELVDRRIRRAIENHLTGRDFHPVERAQADFLVRYDVAVEQRVRSSGISSGFSFGISSGMRFGSIGIGTGTQTETYQQGTLIIDIVDTASGDMVWRGVSSQALHGLSDPQRLTERINATVDRILAQFPPATG